MVAVMVVEMRAPDITPLTPYAVRDEATVRLHCPRYKEPDRVYYLTPMEALSLSRDLQAYAINVLQSGVR